MQQSSSLLHARLQGLATHYILALHFELFINHSFFSEITRRKFSTQIRSGSCAVPELSLFLYMAYEILYDVKFRSSGYFANLTQHLAIKLQEFPAYNRF
jgi:hypothetical protein